MTSAKRLADQIAALRDSSRCWNALSPSSKYYPELNCIDSLCITARAQEVLEYFG